MDVFVIPVGSIDTSSITSSQSRKRNSKRSLRQPGSSRGLQRRFSELLREAEEHGDEEKDQTATSWTQRMRDRMMAWIAKRVAEQRLLWNLRREERVVAVHPTDVPFDVVLPQIQQTLQKGLRAPPVLARRRYHRVDRVRSAGDRSGAESHRVLLPVPCRAGTGCRCAEPTRDDVACSGRAGPCEALNGLRDALQLPRRERHSRVQQIASTLHLRNLPTFFERVTAKKTELALVK